MMRSLIESSLHFRLLIVSLAAVIMFFGFVNLRDTPMDMYPEFTPPQVEVQTEALGLSAEEVEQLITVPLEADLLNGVAWLDKIESESIPGLSRVLMTFEKGTDVMRARQMVQEKLTQAHALPNVSKAPVMIQPVSSTARVIKIGMSSSQHSLIDMSVLARWVMQPKLMGVPGVANVAIFGQRNRQLQVQVDPEKLRAHGVTLTQVVATAGDALWISPLTFLKSSLPGTGGFIETPQQRLSVQHVLPITTPEHLAQVAVDGADGLVLGDVANVIEEHQPLIGDALVDEEAALILVIEKFPWASTADVTAGVEKAIDSMRPGMTGVTFDTEIFRPATFIDLAKDNYLTTLLIAAALVALGTLALLYNWRAALVSLVAMPVSVLVAFYILKYMGAGLDSMIFAGLVLALGVVVDDAIVTVENITRRLRESKKSNDVRSPIDVIAEGALETRGAAFYATAALALTIVPMFLYYGVTGAFLKPVAMAYLLAVAGSVLVALTVTPALAFLLLKNASPSESPMVGGFRRLYDGVLSGFVKAPGFAFATMGALAIIGIVVFPMLQQGTLIPTFQHRDFVVGWSGAPGASHPAMSRITSDAAAELRAIPGIRNVSAHVGRASDSDEVSNVNYAELWVSMSPAADYDATMAAVQGVIDGYPGLSRHMGTYAAHRVNEIHGSDDRLTVRVYGNDNGIVRTKAEEVLSIVEKVNGVAAAELIDEPAEPTIEIEVDLAKAEAHDIKPGDVRRAAAILLSGIEVGALYQDQKVFEVVVWGEPSIRQSVSDVRDLLIQNPLGEYLRLGDVADVRIAPAPVKIRREGVATIVDIGATVEGRDIATVAADIDARLREIEFPLEYHAEVVEGAVLVDASRKELLGFSIASLVGILLVVQAAVGSWSLAVIMFVSLPLALVGGLVAAMLNGGVLSLGATLGLFAVFAIAARNNIGLVSNYLRLRFDGGAEFGPDLVRQGTHERFASILTTAVVTAAIFLPFAISRTAAGNEVLHPMAIVVLGGLVSSTLVTLFVVPSLYARFGEGATPAVDPTGDEDRDESPQIRRAYG